MSSDGLGIYKTTGTTPSEWWENWAKVIALLILGWGVGGTSLVLVSVLLWYSGGAPLWLKAVLALWDLIVFGAFATMSADVVRTFRTSWILNKTRKGNA